jgi:hypothetical protein
MDGLLLADSCLSRPAALDPKRKFLRRSGPGGCQRLSGRISRQKRMDGLCRQVNQNRSTTVPARDFEQSPLQLWPRFGTVPVPWIIFNVWSRNRYWTEPRGYCTEYCPDELDLVGLQEGRELIASEPLVVPREPRWSPVSFNVANVPIVVLRRNVGGLKHIAQVGIPANLISLFQDEIIHLSFETLTVEGPLLAKLGRSRQLSSLPG